jgi:hypothetical protein
MTVRLEQQAPGATRGDAFFGDRLLNGMFATIMDHDPEAPGDPLAFRLYFPWNAYEQDGIHCLPEVDVRLRLVEGQLLPVRILLGMREPGAKAPFSPLTRRVFTPGDGASWEAAKHMARVSATLDTELGNHLGQCHFNVEQYAIAAHRNLRKNPPALAAHAAPARGGADQPVRQWLPGGLQRLHHPRQRVDAAGSRDAAAPSDGQL